MEGHPLVIAISGKSGCGNSTVTRLVSERLGISLINYTMRNMAAERGMSLERLLELARGDPSWDRALDERQIELAKAGDCVIGSRLAIWMIKNASLTIYLEAALETRARRIWTREGGELANVLEITRERDEHDIRRYKAIYGIDTNDHAFVDLVINTERMSPERIVEIISAAAKNL